MIYRARYQSADPYQVDKFVLPFNEDGHSFIRSSMHTLLAQHLEADVTPLPPRSSRKDPKAEVAERTILTRPRTFSHFVLNLPASALTFLPAFIGLYAGYETLFFPHTEARLPLIHVYCFYVKTDDNEEAEKGICNEIKKQLGCDIVPGYMDNDGEVSIWDVRDVAPKKRMFCASFRLPAVVAFGKA